MVFAQEEWNPANISDEEDDIIDEGYADIEVPNERIVHRAQINKRDATTDDTKEIQLRNQFAAECDVTNDSITCTDRLRGPQNMMQDTNRSYSIISMNESQL